MTTERNIFRRNMFQRLQHYNMLLEKTDQEILDHAKVLQFDMDFF